MTQARRREAAPRPAHCDWLSSPPELPIGIGSPAREPRLSAQAWELRQNSYLVPGVPDGRPQVSVVGYGSRVGCPPVSGPRGGGPRSAGCAALGLGRLPERVRPRRGIARAKRVLRAFSVCLSVPHPFLHVMQGPARRGVGEHAGTREHSGAVLVLRLGSPDPAVRAPGTCLRARGQLDCRVAADRGIRS